MLLTEEQVKKGYPYQAVRFLNSFSSYLSEKTDEYGLRIMLDDSFSQFEKIEKGMSGKLKAEYYDSIKSIHAYIDAGNSL